MPPMGFIEGLKSREYINYLLEKVSLDHDGTIANTRQSVTDEFNRRHNTIRKVDELFYWDAVIDWCKDVGMSPDEARAENFDLWYKPKALYHARPVLGARELLSELERRGSEYIINSSRLPSLHASTLKWYKRKIPVVPEHKIHTGLPDISDGVISKIWRIQKSGLRLHLEDVPEHAKDILDYTSATVILLSNLPNLDGYAQGRLMRIGTNDGTLPDMRKVNDLLFS